MKLWTSMRCDLPPEIQTTCELFLSYENLKISLKLVHKKIDLKLSPLNIINLNFSKNLCMKQDEDAPLPFATLIKMEICIRHTFSFVTSFSASSESSGTSSLKNKTCKKQTKQKKETKSHQRAICNSVRGRVKKHCLIWPMAMCSSAEMFLEFSR